MFQVQSRNHSCTTVIGRHITKKTINTIVGWPETRMTLCFGWKRGSFRLLGRLYRTYCKLCVWYVWIHYGQLSMYTSKKQTDIVDISGSSVMSWFTLHPYVAPIATVDRKMNKWVRQQYQYHPHFSTHTVVVVLFYVHRIIISQTYHNLSNGPTNPKHDQLCGPKLVRCIFSLPFFSECFYLGCPKLAILLLVQKSYTGWGW